jgi:hypothetical protein
MKRGFQVPIVVAAVMALSAPIAASGGTTPDPDLNDTVLGTTDGVRYASDVATYDGGSGFASVAAGCGTFRWHLLGGGAMSGGAAATAWQAANRPEDYTDADTDGDDGWLVGGYGVNPDQVTAYSICIRDGQITYPFKDVADSSSGLRSGSVHCGGAKWQVTTGSPFIATSHSWINSSRPRDTGDAGSDPDDRWAGDVYDTVGGIGGFNVYAVCAAHLVLRYVKKDAVSVSAGSSVSRLAGCTSGEHVVGGGPKVSGPEDQARLVSTFPVDDGDPDSIPDDGWQSRVYNISGSDKDVTAYAICLR